MPPRTTCLAQQELLVVEAHPCIRCWLLAGLAPIKPCGYLVLTRAELADRGGVVEAACLGQVQERAIRMASGIPSELSKNVINECLPGAPGGREHQLCPRSAWQGRREQLGERGKAALVEERARRQLRRLIAKRQQYTVNVEEDDHKPHAQGGRPR
eukprot:scaffold320076_cov39-Tisochrysis_lutea.AAC.1